MWLPTQNMYFYEIAAICGVSVKALKAAITELTQNKTISVEWVAKTSCNYRAITELIKYFQVDTSIEKQIITVLTIARDKNQAKRRTYQLRKINQFKK